MSFTNLQYDKGTYKTEIEQSEGPGLYTINKPRISSKQCYPYPPTVRLQEQGDSYFKNKSLIDVNSELLGITRYASSDPTEKYIPQCGENSCSTGYPCGQGVIGKCNGLKEGQRVGDNDLVILEDCFIETENTRLSNPPCTLRGTGYNRWDWLCLDPQENCIIPFEHNVSNRLRTKDNFKPCYTNPATHAENGLPDPNNKLSCEPTKHTCANFTSSTPPNVNFTVNKDNVPLPCQSTSSVCASLI